MGASKDCLVVDSFSEWNGTGGWIEDDCDCQAVGGGLLPSQRQGRRTDQAVVEWTDPGACLFLWGNDGIVNTESLTVM